MTANERMKPTDNKIKQDNTQYGLDIQTDLSPWKAATIKRFDILHEVVNRKKQTDILGKFQDSTRFMGLMKKNVNESLKTKKKTMLKLRQSKNTSNQN